MIINNTIATNPASILILQKNKGCVFRFESVVKHLKKKGEG